MSDMLKVMLVDDEYFFREAMKISIPWEKLALTICCEAENGKEALDNLETFRPDIALVDINMPVMDGLALAVAAKSKSIETKLVFITGSDEFSYARQAMQYGVEDYIIKPVEEDELIETLSRIAAKIRSNALKDYEYLALRKKAEESRAISKEKFINDLMQMKIDAEKIDIELINKYLSKVFSCEIFQAIIIEIYERPEYGWKENDRHLWSFAVSNIVSEIFRAGFHSELFKDMEGRICIITGNEKNEENDFEDNVRAVCERIRVYVVKHLKFTVTVGIGTVCSGIEGIVKSYNEAVLLLKDKKHFHDNCVLSYNIMENSCSRIKLFPVEQRKQLLLSMRLSDYNGISKALNKIFMLIRTKNPETDVLELVCVQLVTACMEHIQTNSELINNFLDEKNSLIQEIQSKKSVDEIEEWIKSLVIKAVELTDQKKDRKSKRLVLDIVDCILENYKKIDLKIDYLAKAQNVNYGYLCNVFKRETGLTINDYITEVRMQKAMELIEEGSCSVSGLSSLVGFANANYFGKCFKKTFGISPGEYIEQRSSSI